MAIASAVMWLDRTLALSGLACALAACRFDATNALGWALALTACALLAMPARKLIRRATTLLEAIDALALPTAPQMQGVRVAPVAASRHSLADARINAAIDRFEASKQSGYRRSVGR